MKILIVPFLLLSQAANAERSYFNCVGVEDKSVQVSGNFSNDVGTLRYRDHYHTKEYNFVRYSRGMWTIDRLSANIDFGGGRNQVGFIADDYYGANTGPIAAILMEPVGSEALTCTRSVQEDPTPGQCNRCSWTCIEACGVGVPIPLGQHPDL